jgi:transposase-like protein
LNRKRLPPEDKIRIVLESMNTNITVAGLCRKYAVPQVMFYVWKQKFIDGGYIQME